MRAMRARERGLDIYTTSSSMGVNRAGVSGASVAARQGAFATGDGVPL
jgi:hypothetical protein